MTKLLALLLIASYISSNAQFQFNVEAEKKSADYLNLKDSLIRKYQNFTPGKFGEFVKGVNEDVVTNQKFLVAHGRCCHRPKS